MSLRNKIASQEWVERQIKDKKRHPWVVLKQFNRLCTSKPRALSRKEKLEVYRFVLSFGK